MRPYHYFCASAAFFLLFSCEKKEQEVPVSSVSITQATAEMIIGETVQLNATVLPSDATDKTVIWASSKQSVATVSKSGLVTAIAEGTSTVTASSGGKSASCIVTVSKRFVPVTSVELNKSSIELVEGDSETLTATVKPDDATDKTVTWSTSDATIATVDNGKVAAVKEGTTTVTAKAGEKTATCKVTVAKKIIPVESVTLDKAELALVKGDEFTLSATVKPDEATDKTVIWSTSDAKVATVENGKVKAVGGGSATIIAKVGEKEATCAVTVTDPDIIVFADANLKKALVDAFDTDGDGELSYKEAAAVDSGEALKAAFGSEKDYKSFDEFQYFTGIHEIPYWTFREWTLITSIVLPNSIERVGEAAFSACHSLIEINLPNNVSFIDKFAFQNCWSIQSMCIPPKVVSIPQDCFTGCGELSSVELPDGLIEIGYGAFYLCEELREITIPESVTSIRPQAFKYCSKLNQINIPKSVTIIELESFYGCESLESIDLPDNLTTIGYQAFYLCKNLQTVILPKSVEEIRSGAFAGCCGIQEMTILATKPPQLETGVWGAFSGIPPAYPCNYTIKVPTESVESYKTAQYWDAYSDRIQAIGASVPTAVDLGLSVKWASFNLGATKPEDYGDYYAWGEIEPKSDYSWSTYKWGTSSSGPFSKYNMNDFYGPIDNKTVLEPEDDVAHVKLGGKWRMPTDAEWTELRTKCTWTWVTNYNGSGINGRLVKATNGNSIFLPAAGYRDATGLDGAGPNGDYWSSSLNADYPYGAWLVFFYSGDVRGSYYGRFLGLSVRPVSE